MSSAPIKRGQAAKVASATRRGATSNTPGSYRVRGAQVGSAPDSGDDWIVVEPVASIAARGHAYISFDPA